MFNAEEYGIDEKGPIPVEELDTVVVPETLSMWTTMFLVRLNNLTSSVFVTDSDPQIEFLEAKSILTDLLEDVGSDVSGTESTSD